MTRPLREVIAEIVHKHDPLIDSHGPVPWDALPRYDDEGLICQEECFKLADAILAALPQTEVSETVRRKVFDLIYDFRDGNVISKREAQDLTSTILQALALPVDGWRERIDLADLYWKCYPHGPETNELALEIWVLLRNVLQGETPLPPAPPDPESGGEDAN